MTIIIVDMENFLITLGFTKKEVQVYLSLLEFGLQPASVIAKKVHMPKATALFLLNRLHEGGYITRSQRGRTQYYFADPQSLKEAKEKEIARQSDSLEKLLPILNEYKNPLTSPPKIQFYEGVEGCRKAYSLLLESTSEILEFGAHDDLVTYFGEDFMAAFIKERVKRKIMLYAISSDAPGSRQMQHIGKKEFRDVFIFNKKRGTIYSSIAIFEDKMLLLNFFGDPFAILIQNSPVAQTMKTIHALAWGKQKKADQ